MIIVSFYVLVMKHWLEHVLPCYCYYSEYIVGYQWAYLKSKGLNDQLPIVSFTSPIFFLPATPLLSMAAAASDRKNRLKSEPIISVVLSSVNPTQK